MNIIIHHLGGLETCNLTSKLGQFSPHLKRFRYIHLKKKKKNVDTESAAEYEMMTTALKKKVPPEFE